ncbi:MAG: hypothetical protein ACKO3N_15045 [Verrucomicrobiota bacterium]
MNLSLKIPQADQFQAAIARYIRDLKADLPATIRRQGRLLLREAMGLTPPRTRTQGRKVVRTQVLRAVRPMSPSDFDSRQLRKLARKRDYERLQKAFDAMPSGPFSGKRIVPFSPTLHQEARDRRGRVPEKYDTALTLDVKEVRAYIRQAQDHVGRAKGGWASGVVALGGKVPGWVSRWTGTGRFRDELANPVLRYIRQENTSEWAGRGDEDRVLARAMEGRTKAILGDLERRLAATTQGAFS